MRSLFVAALVLSSSLAFAEVTPEKAASIERERQKALDDIAKKYGNKKPSELSNDERRAKMTEESEAMNKVLDKAGVSAKEYSKFEATASNGERQAAKAAGAAMEKKETDEKAAAAKAAADAKKAPEIIIEKDTDKKNGPKSKKQMEEEVEKQMHPKGPASKR